MKIEKFSHHFVVSGFNQVEKEAILKFVLRFAETSFDRFGNKVIVRTYAASTKSRKEFRFHINSFDSFSLHIQERGLIVPDEDVITYTLYEPVKVVYGKLQKDPRDYQVPIIAFNLMPSPLAKLITLQPGYGKALHHETPVLTPLGWVPIKDLHEGSLVTTPNGWRTRVTGVYPQGKVSLFKVTFKDGRTSYCCKEHLWKARKTIGFKLYDWETVNTETIMETLSKNSTAWHIPLPEPWVGLDNILPLDPYLLGLMLANADFNPRHPIAIRIDKGELKDRLTTLITEYSNRFYLKGKDYNIILPNKETGEHYIKDTLVTLELNGVRSPDKFIPNIYKNAKLKDRLALLQGIMDMSGEPGIQNHGTLSVHSKQLAEDIQYLVRSLGGTCKLSQRSTKLSTTDKQIYYVDMQVLHIKLRTPSTLFTIANKPLKVSDNDPSAKLLDLEIVSVEPAGEDEAVCISVEHKDKLYIAEDFVVTHNTFIALATVAASEQRFVLATKGGFVTRWLRDCCGEDSVLGLIHEDVIVVKGSEALKVVIELALSGQLEFKGLLISTNTLNNYYKHYFDNDGDMSEYGGLHPVALWQVLNIGILITDEFHMLIHMNFIREMYNHVPKTIALSGTMIPDGPFMKLIHDTLFPKECIAPEPTYTKYIAVKALFYGIHADTKEIKCFRNAKYSHTMYEESIINKPKVLKRYTDMLLQMGVNIYDREGRHEPGEKMIIYVSTQDMATRLTDIYKAHFGDKYIINRFVSLDPYSHVEDSDIIISTPGSLGTAHDVYKLRYTLLTTALGKEDTNIQLLFRLRKPTWNPEVTPEMYYLVNREVKKHMDYHYRKRELFKPITLSQIELETPFKV